jgi:hypothetical protein
MPLAHLTPDEFPVLLAALFVGVGAGLTLGVQGVLRLLARRRR